MTERRRVAEEFGLGYGGWLRYRCAGLPAHAFLRFEERAGRLVPVDMVLVSEDGAPHLDTDTLRRVPLGMLDAIANGEFREGIAHGLRIPAPDVRTAIAAFGTSVNPSSRHPERWTWVDRMIVEQYGVVETKRPAPPKFEPLREEVEVCGPDATLAVPQSRPYGDGFYRRVANIYGELVKCGVAPAPAIADANEVPVTTAHRWVKEARRRKLLAPGRQGKAG